MDPDEEACTAASLDHLFERLQSLDAADQLRSNSVLPVVVNIRSRVVHCVVGDPSNPATWQTRCGFRYGSLPYVRYADSREFMTVRPTRYPSVVLLKQRAAVTWVQMAPLQLHPWPKTRKRVGGWVRWSVYCDLQVFLCSIGFCGKHSQVWSLAGAAHLLNNNADVLM